jgi:hypothetical protein
LCIGASIDFLTGKQHRAPVWLQKVGLEWLHRLLSNPRRLAFRYLIECPRIFHLMFYASGRRETSWSISPVGPVSRARFNPTESSRQARALKLVRVPAQQVRLSLERRRPDRAIAAANTAARAATAMSGRLPGAPGTTALAEDTVAAAPSGEDACRPNPRPIRAGAHR